MTLAAAACSQANTCTVGVVTVVSGIALGAANCAQVNTCTVGVVAISLARVKIFGHYSSQDALTARFGAAVLVQLTNASDYSATAVDGNVLAAAIADVDALIDAKLAARYTLPIATLPLVLRNLACDLVRARLAADTMTDRMAERERAGLKLLDEIAAGKVQLGLDRAALETPASDGPTVVAGNPGRVFTPSGLADYHF